MSQPKTQCKTCGASIVQRTADEHDGLCVPCHRAAAAIPPADFEIAPELAQRLVLIDEDPAVYRESAWQFGEGFKQFVDMLEERHSLYRDWSPRLYDFAKECRERNPCPSERSLSNAEREMQRIYEAKLDQPKVNRENRVAICRMPLLAIPVAHRIWPKDLPHTVILTPEEEQTWNEIYTHSQDAPWWFAHFWWIVDDSPEPPSSADNPLAPRWSIEDVPDGQTPWLVNIGFSRGPLAGGGNTELWSWDGTKASLVTTAQSWIS